MDSLVFDALATLMGLTTPIVLRFVRKIGDTLLMMDGDRNRDGLDEVKFMNASTFHG